MDNVETYCLKLLKLEQETRTRMLVSAKALDDFSLVQYVDRLTYSGCYDEEMVEERVFKALQCRIRAYLVEKAFMQELQSRWNRVTKRFEGRAENEE